MFFHLDDSHLLPRSNRVIILPIPFYKKEKKIGIRKLLGATISSIISLLSREYLQPILMAFVLASITIWYPMHTWLEAFPFRRPIHWWIFLIAGGFVIIIAFMTISIQIIKAALANPVHCLKSSE
ncbi:ABC transporter permease [Arachidicoccus rhizosphaerae]|uniref:ABC transporter permease n=1 Tax=Arachidicoccus rhizosphaerae TaxID=551991 RepID=UPI00147F42AE